MSKYHINIVPFERMKFVDNEVAVDDISITYIQNNDTTEDQDEVQTITISTRNNGAGRFLHIKTEGWSIEDGEEMNRLLNDFCDRAALHKESEIKTINDYTLYGKLE